MTSAAATTSSKSKEEFHLFCHLPPLWQALRFQDKLRFRHGAYSRLPCSIPCRASETACHRASERHAIVSTTTPRRCPFITSIALLLLNSFRHSITQHSSTTVAAGLPPTCLRRIPWIKIQQQRDGSCERDGFIAHLRIATFHSRKWRASYEIQSSETAERRNQYSTDLDQPMP